VHLDVLSTISIRSPVYVSRRSVSPDRVLELWKDGCCAAERHTHHELAELRQFSTKRTQAATYESRYSTFSGISDFHSDSGRRDIGVVV
jgi:hypothetical protein